MGQIFSSWKVKQEIPKKVSGQKVSKVLRGPGFIGGYPMQDFVVAKSLPGIKRNYFFKRVTSILIAIMMVKPVKDFVKYLG